MSISLDSCDEDSCFDDASSSDVGSIFSDEASESELSTGDALSKFPECSLPSAPVAQVLVKSSTPMKKQQLGAKTTPLGNVCGERFSGRKPIFECLSGSARRRINALITSEPRKAKTPRRMDKENIPNSLSSIRSRFEERESCALADKSLFEMTMMEEDRHAQQQRHKENLKKFENF